LGVNPLFKGSGNVSAAMPPLLRDFQGEYCGIGSP
jgi:hypothetical protein